MGQATKKPIRITFQYCHCKFQAYKTTTLFHCRFSLINWIHFLPARMKTQRNYKTSQEGIEARKLAKQMELTRRFKLKKQLQKLYKEEGIESETLAVKDGHRNTKVVETKSLTSQKKTRLNPLEKIQKERDEKAKERAEQKQFKLQQEQERMDQQRASIVKRRDANITLSKKTKKGQPVMKNQINHLLDKIKSTK
jgi:cobalamin-dependent methionine synthase I